jgi:hypothetical protein
MPHVVVLGRDEFGAEGYTKITQGRSSMWNKPTIGVGLVALVLSVTVLMCDGEAKMPPLQADMTKEEVEEALGTSESPCLDLFHSHPVEARTHYYYPKFDWLGHQQRVAVSYGKDGLVVLCGSKPSPALGRRGWTGH